MARRIYIAGPMRGRPDHNFPAFNRAAGLFDSLGWEVLNPVDIGQELAGNNPDTPGGTYLRADIAVITTCDAMALLPEWEHSTGARCEVAVGITLGLEFFDAITGRPITPPSRVTICGGYERGPGKIETLDELAAEILGWQHATFTHRTRHSIATHLKKEAAELADAPDDDSEAADCFMLALAAASEGRDLISIVRAKLERNKRRIWGQPDVDGVVEHVAEAVS